MMGNNRISIVVIWLTLLIGLCIQIIPWSTEYNIFKPHLLMLIMAYWLIALPHRIGMGLAFILVIVLDLFSG